MYEDTERSTEHGARTDYDSFDQREAQLSRAPRGLSFEGFKVPPSRVVKHCLARVGRWLLYARAVMDYRSRVSECRLREREAGGTVFPQKDD